jgi:sugar phosphate isomerase/epimerase
MISPLGRRQFLKSTAALATLASLGIASAGVGSTPGATTQPSAVAGRRARRVGGPKFKTSLNVYSFQSAILGGRDGSAPTMTLLDVLEFCARHNFDGIDPTGYYFPGYPNVPTDAYLAAFKKRAFELGVGISGTGIRNNFATADRAVRTRDIALAKAWVEVAAKMGAPVLRVFAGAEDKGANRDDVYGWMSDALLECAEHGKKFGVVIGVQNHGDFLRTAEQTIHLLEKVNSEWVGLILDTGNFPTDPYREIAATLPYAVNFQVKESPYGRNSTVRLDLKRFVQILRAGEYRGYLPIETLVADGVPYDARVVVPKFLAELESALASA